MSDVQHPFTLCTANPPRKVLKLGQQSLQDDGIESSCLLVVEEDSSLDEDEWLDALNSSSESQVWGLDVLCAHLCVDVHVWLVALVVQTPCVSGMKKGVLYSAIFSLINSH